CCRGEADPARLAAEYTSYGDLKRDVVEAVVETLRPIRKRYTELETDPAYVDGVLAEGAARASVPAGTVLRRAQAAIGVGCPCRSGRPAYSGWPAASARERLRAASTAVRNAARTLWSSSSRIAAAVVPPGEVTRSRSTTGCSPVSRSSLADPTAVWTAS